MQPKRLPRNCWNNWNANCNAMNRCRKNSLRSPSEQPRRLSGHSSKRPKRRTSWARPWKDPIRLFKNASGVPQGSFPTSLAAATVDASLLNAAERAVGWANESKIRPQLNERGKRFAKPCNKRIKWAAKTPCCRKCRRRPTRWLARSSPRRKLWRRCKNNPNKQRIRISTRMIQSPPRKRSVGKIPAGCADATGPSPEQREESMVWGRAGMPGDGFNRLSDRNAMRRMRNVRSRIA